MAVKEEKIVNKAGGYAFYRPYLCMWNYIYMVCRRKWYKNVEY